MQDDMAATTLPVQNVHLRNRPPSRDRHDYSRLHEDGYRDAERVFSVSVAR